MNEASYEVTTQYEKGIGEYHSVYGAIFTIKPYKNLTISSFDIHTSVTASSSADNVYCSIYTMSNYNTFGDYFKRRRWEKLINTTISNPLGLGMGTPLDETFELNVIENVTQAFYIKLNIPELIVLEFAESEQDSRIFVKNSDLEIYRGRGVLNNTLTLHRDSNLTPSHVVYSGTIWYKMSDQEELEGKNSSSSKTNFNPEPPDAQELITEFKGDELIHGCIFDVVTLKHDVNITLIDIHTPLLNETFFVEVWILQQDEKSNWKQVYYQESVVGYGQWIATPLISFSNIITLPAKSTTTFYVTSDSDSLFYSPSSSTKLQNGDVFSQNQDLFLYIGYGVDIYPYNIQEFDSSNDNSNIIKGLGFNGIIHYIPLLNSTPVLKNNCPTSLSGLFSNMLSTVHSTSTKNITDATASYGNMITIQAKKPSVLRALSLNLLQNQLSRYSIWIKNGTFVNEEHNPHQNWYFVQSGTLNSAGLTDLDLSSPIPLQAFMNVSIFINLDTPNLIYQNLSCSSSNPSGICEENQDMILYESSALLRDRFTSEVIQKISWEGNLYYYLIDPDCIEQVFHSIPTIWHEENRTNYYFATTSASPVAAPTLSPSRVTDITDELDPNKVTKKEFQYFYYYVIQTTAAESIPEELIMTRCEKLWKRYINQDPYLTKTVSDLFLTSYHVTSSSNLTTQYCNTASKFANMLCTVANNSITLRADSDIDEQLVNQFIHKTIPSIIQDNSGRFNSILDFIGPFLFTTKFQLQLFLNEHLSGVLSQSHIKTIQYAAFHLLQHDNNREEIDIYSVTLTDYHTIYNDYDIVSRKKRRSLARSLIEDAMSSMTMDLSIDGKTSYKHILYKDLIQHELIKENSSFYHELQTLQYFNHSIQSMLITASSDTSNTIDNTNSTMDETVEIGVIIGIIAGTLFILVLFLMYCIKKKEKTAKLDKVDIPPPPSAQRKKKRFKPRTSITSSAGQSLISRAKSIRVPNITKRAKNVHGTKRSHTKNTTNNSNTNTTNKMKYSTATVKKKSGLNESGKDMDRVYLQELENLSAKQSQDSLVSVEFLDDPYASNVAVTTTNQTVTTANEQLQSTLLTNYQEQQLLSNQFLEVSDDINPSNSKSNSKLELSDDITPISSGSLYPDASKLKNLELSNDILPYSNKEELMKQLDGDDNSIVNEDNDTFSDAQSMTSLNYHLEMSDHLVDSSWRKKQSSQQSNQQQQQQKNNDPAKPKTDMYYGLEMSDDM